MDARNNDRTTRLAWAVLFGVFAFSWIHFFQGELLCAMLRSVTGGKWNALFEHRILITLPLTLLVLLTAIPSHRLIGFKGGMYACNYLLPAILLGALTGYSSTAVFGQTLSQWITVLAISIALWTVCKIVASVPKSQYCKKQREACGNLFILSILFCITATLGNTDENLHRKLRIEHYLHLGQYEKALSIGVYEHETNSAISLARLDAMLRMDAQKPGSGVGEYLFTFPLDNAKELLEALSVMSGRTEYDSNSVEIAQALISRNLSKAESLIAPYIDKGVMPKYYMQLMVLTGNQQAAAKHSVQYSEQKAILDSFKTQLEQLSSENLRFQSNSTYIDYHTTYYWFYTFTD